MRTIKKYSIVLAVLGLYTGTASAHEHWVDMNQFYPAVDETNRISICSGHSFPKSATLLGKRLLHDLRIFLPDNKSTVFKTTSQDQRWVSDLAIKTAGTVIVSFSLKKPQIEDPFYRATAIVICGNADNNESSYSTGKGLEIVPTGKLSQARKTGALPLTLLLNGKRVSARLTILPEHGKSTILSTTEKRPAELKINKNSRYLVTTSYKGKGCSLAFALE
ncbi:MAG: DUF4198 domain-containing protein [Kiritimatiellae bacterium]|nr:DUF4198 domain-containing protein [Kiritimatiellia bacterium]